MNEDLTEAIALGHDLGHTPFGHNGEDVLNMVHPGGFEHNVQSLRVVDVLESTATRTGMNLTARGKGRHIESYRRAASLLLWKVR